MNIHRPHYNENSERLRQIREESGLRQKELAERVGWSKGHISALELGTKKCTPEHIEKVSKAV